MIEYITAQDVTDTLGSGWADGGDETRAVLEANAWMTSRGVMASDPVEQDIITAGAYLAQSAAQGELYADRTGAVKREAVSAGSVSTETEYQDGATASTGIMRLVLDLLRPYLPAGGGSTFAVRRA